MRRHAGPTSASAAFMTAASPPGRGLRLSRRRRGFRRKRPRSPTLRTPCGAPPTVGGVDRPARPRKPARQGFGHVAGADESDGRFHAPPVLSGTVPSQPTGTSLYPEAPAPQHAAGACGTASAGMRPASVLTGVSFSANIAPFHRRNALRAKCEARSPRKEPSCPVMRARCATLRWWARKRRARRRWSRRSSSRRRPSSARLGR